MENKKPQGAPTSAKAQAKSAPANVTQPKQTTQAKSKQATPANVTQPKATAQAKPKHATPAKVTQPKATTQARSKQATPANVTQPKQTTQAKPKQTTPANVTQPKATAQAKPNQPVPTKAMQSIQKPPSVEGKTASVKESSVTKPQSPVTNASASKAPIGQTPVAKAPILPKGEAAANQSKPQIARPVQTNPLPKASSEAKPTSAPKAAFAEKPVQSEPIKTTEQKAAKKNPPKAGFSEKLSAFSKLATKGFMIQSWQIAIALVTVVVLVVGSILLGTILGNQDTDDPIVDYTGPLVNKNPDDPGNIALPGYPALIFPANNKKVTLELPNPDGNPCYFRYTLTVVETGEVLYESELLEPGKTIQEPTLNRALPKGTYTLRITIDTFSLADSTIPMNGGVQEVKLIVK